MAKRTPAHERVLRKVVISDTPFMGEPCWIFTGSRNEFGYGRTSTGSKPAGTFRLARTHRVVYEALVGPIPDGLQIDHLCRQTSCCNPAHLEAVTPAVNTLRAMPFRSGRDPDKCVNGHPREEGIRHCRACGRDRDRRRDKSPERATYKREYRRARRAMGLDS